VAVSVTLTADATAEVVAWKLPVLAPAGMFTVAGTVTEDWLLDKVTFMPPAGAAAERLIVHWLGLPPVTGDGVQPNEEMLGGSELPLPLPLPLPPLPLPLPPPTVIEPEVADSATGPPDGSDPATAPSVTLNVEAVAVRLKVSEATTPLPITFVFIPSSMQL
jgi:hypothetical protein